MTSPTGELAMRRNRALAHPVRLRILAMLATGRLCPCRIAAVLGLGPGAVATHLRVLRNVELVVETKAGSLVEYGLSSTAGAAGTPPTGAAALAGVLLDDAEFTSLLQRVPPEHLCLPAHGSGTFGLRLPAPSAAAAGRETSAAKRHARPRGAGGALSPAGGSAAPWRRRETPDLARSFRSHAAIRTTTR